MGSDRGDETTKHARLARRFGPLGPEGPRQVVEIQRESGGRHGRAEPAREVVVAPARTDRLTGPLGQQVKDGTV